MVFSIPALSASKDEFFAALGGTHFWSRYGNEMCEVASDTISSILAGMNWLPYYPWFDHDCVNTISQMQFASNSIMCHTQES